MVHDLTFSLNHDTSVNDMVNKRSCSPNATLDPSSIASQIEHMDGACCSHVITWLCVPLMWWTRAFRTKTVAPEDMSKFSYFTCGRTTSSLWIHDCSSGTAGAPGHFQRHSNAMTEAHNSTHWDDPAIDRYMGMPSYYGRSISVSRRVGSQIG